MVHHPALPRRGEAERDLVNFSRDKSKGNNWHWSRISYPIFTSTPRTGAIFCSINVQITQLSQMYELRKCQPAWDKLLWGLLEVRELYHQQFLWQHPASGSRTWRHLARLVGGNEASLSIINSISWPSNDMFIRTGGNDSLEKRVIWSWRYWLTLESCELSLIGQSSIPVFQ